MSSGGVRLRGFCTGLLLSLALILVGGPPASAAPAGMSFTASLNGRDATTLTRAHPLELRSRTPLEVTLQVTNNTNDAITIAGTRVHGSVMGLTFFDYDIQVGLAVGPGTTQTTTFRIGLAGLAGRAVGLVPTTIALLDDNADVVAAKSITVDVDGDITSTYGQLGIAIAALTLLWLGALLHRVRRRRLPGNPWIRAACFGAAGVGLGLTITFATSAGGLLVPGTAVWLPLVLGFAAIGLVVGYLLPGRRPVGPDQEALIAALTARLAPFGGPAAPGTGPLGARPSPQPRDSAPVPPGGSVGAFVSRRPPRDEQR